MIKISEKEYAKILFDSTKSLNEKELSDILKNFVKLLSRHRSIGKINKIINEYKKIFNEENKIKEVIVTTKEVLSESMKENLKSNIKREFKAEDVELTEKIDKEIIGGIKIKTEELIYDNTILRKLSFLKKELINK